MGAATKIRMLLCSRSRVGVLAAEIECPPSAGASLVRLFRSALKAGQLIARKHRVEIDSTTVGKVRDVASVQLAAPVCAADCFIFHVKHFQAGVLRGHS